MRTLIALAFIALVAADVYMHNPRGSNDRLNEENTNRNNANRLFDSQNNDKGGYCLGDSMSYYEGSHLSVEWTAQHSCGSDNAECQIVIQYMCTADNDQTARIRDGTTTNTIPDDMATYNQLGAGGAEYEFGMHEDYYYYQRCKGRERNQGLFFADQTPRNDIGARSTRQNNNGNKHGFECPEERDYYPYWAPSPWRDVAILTTNPGDLCSWYRDESQNVMSKWECVDPTDPNMPFINAQNDLAGLTQVACGSGTWQETQSWGIGSPDCIEAPFSRDNHLGNGKNGYNNMYNMTMPDDEDCLDNDNCVCVLRLRYNISTYDTDNWVPNDADGWGQPMDNKAAIDAMYNGDSSPLTEDPMVMVSGQNLTLALDTSQYGRTFQDRSHVFYLRQRPSTVTGEIHNVNVRGKRGNIVQTYPAVEYDFVPTFLHLPQFDNVHFQWTGCDTNPAGNAGEGRDQTDRSNIVQIGHPRLNYPLTDDQISSLGSKSRLFDDDEVRLDFAYAGQDVASCPTYDQLFAANAGNANDIEDDPTNCFVLNAAEQHYDGGIIAFGAGTLGKSYNYMSTRNNNFSNRSQKAGIVVEPAISDAAIGAIVGAGSAALVGAGMGASAWASKVNPNSGLARPWSATFGRLMH